MNLTHRGVTKGGVAFRPSDLVNAAGTNPGRHHSLLPCKCNRDIKLCGGGERQTRILYEPSPGWCFILQMPRSKQVEKPMSCQDWNRGRESNKEEQMLSRKMKTFELDRVVGHGVEVSRLQSGWFGWAGGVSVERKKEKEKLRMSVVQVQAQLDRVAYACTRA